MFLRGVAEADQEGKFIGARLVDVNKGTKKVPKVRSRLVGQACGHGARRCSDSTTGCSPILAVHMRESRKTRLRRQPHTCWTSKMLFSTAISPGTSTSSCLPKVLCLSGHMVGKLDKAMYGTSAGGVGEDDG